MLPLHAYRRYQELMYRRAPAFIASAGGRPAMPPGPLRTAEADVARCPGQPQMVPLACTLASVRPMDSARPRAGYQQFTRRRGREPCGLSGLMAIPPVEPTWVRSSRLIVRQPSAVSPRLGLFARDGQVRCGLLVLEYLDCDERVYGVPRALPFLSVKSAGTA